MPATGSDRGRLRRARLALERWAIRDRPVRPGRRRRWIPRPTVRLRLTLVYGSLFLIAGALLLGITYGLASHHASETADQAVLLRAASATGVGAAPSPGGGLVIQQTVSGPLPPGAVVPAKFRGAAQALQRAAVFQSRVDRNSQLSALLTESGIALAIMAFVSIGLGWLMAGRVLAPVRTMNARVRQISEHNLHERLALAGHDDELKELGDNFDELLARLESAFESQRAFVANASHELRTPVTVERALVEVALADPDATVESLRDTCRRVVVAGEQQERTIEALLTLARSQSGVGAHGRVDLAKIVAEAIAGADHGDVKIESRLGPASTVGDPGLIERLVANLLSNAVHHNADHGWARVATGIEDGRPTLTVVNGGDVIDAADTDGLMQPFRRLNGDRTRHGRGIGLGLSIVGAIATAHGAEVRLTAPPSGGLQVKVAFPPV
jgi:signal transduction histidine kinase